MLLVRFLCLGEGIGNKGLGFYWEVVVRDGDTSFFVGFRGKVMVIGKRIESSVRRDEESEYF